jgi:ferrous iron transport protein B
MRQKIALVGNPNSGKTSLFNHLTGLNQKIGNFPGVTVDKKSGVCALPSGGSIEILDLPGSYSLYAKSKDEEVVTEILCNRAGDFYPDRVIVVADASNLKRNLLLFTQVKDLGIPCVLVLNMGDIANRMGKAINIDKLSEQLGVPVLSMNGRTGEGLTEIKEKLAEPEWSTDRAFLDVTELAGPTFKEAFKADTELTPYQKLHQRLEHDDVDEALAQSIQVKDTTLRYAKINRVIKQSEYLQAPQGLKMYTDKIDSILTHKVWGYVIFIAILFIMFQAIYSWAAWPMEMIDLSVSNFSGWLGRVMPPGVFTDLLKDGIVPGVGGILLFIPQIAILFAFIALLEESGYMARVVFLLDKIMRRVGLNGKSIVPLISGVACAIPAIMATRTIELWKERLITIFVTPLMSCSARLPVYTILIALVIPEKYIWGVFNLQGLVLLGLYLLGFVAAMLSALLLQKLIKSKERSFLIMELPTYKMPRWKNIGLTIVEKVRTFTFEAGKVIVAISIVLWVLASYGPGDNIKNADEIVADDLAGQTYTPEQFDDQVASYKLEHSYAASLGRLIEPAIRPLGFDWKIGIALVTSFAAREVFVGTMATLYSIQSASDDEASIKSRMQQEINPRTGEPLFSLAMGLSLMVFYAFAMQCMSTLAVVYRETKSWKWPVLQTIYMSALAYVSSLIVYNIFS